MSNYLFDGLTKEANPDQQFARIPGTEGRPDRYYSYAHLCEVSAMFANRLVRLGVKPGDRVAVQVPKSIEAVMLYFGTVRAGAVFLPLNTAYTQSEVRYFLEDATPAVFVCNPQDRDDYSEMASQLNIALETMGVWTDPDTSAGSMTDDPNDADKVFTDVARGADDLAAILYTSGTTGRSKGAMLTHDNLLSNALVLKDLWAFSPRDVLLHALPIFHTHGLFVAINTIVVSGASMIFLPAFVPDQIIDELPNSTSMMGVPTFYTRLLSEKRFTKDLVQHMRLFISGSAPLLAETHKQFEKQTGQRILERYGMTETNMNTSNPYDGERRPGTVGFALPRTKVRIADPETGALLPDGEVGVLEVSGPNVFAGYWKMPEKTREEFRDDGYFISGDLAKIDEDGYVHIVGRAKDLIISGGYNIYPKEIELVLDEQDHVVESAVVGVPHPDFGEAVVAVVVGSSSFNPAIVGETLSDKLAKFKQPKAIKVVDELPRNTMGKVQKNILRERFENEFRKEA